MVFKKLRQSLRRNKNKEEPEPSTPVKKEVVEEVRGCCGIIWFAAIWGPWSPCGIVNCCRLGFVTKLFGFLLLFILLYLQKQQAPDTPATAPVDEKPASPEPAEQPVQEDDTDKSDTEDNAEREAEQPEEVEPQDPEPEDAEEQEASEKKAQSDALNCDALNCCGVTIPVEWCVWDPHLSFARCFFLHSMPTRGSLHYYYYYYIFYVFKGLFIVSLCPYRTRSLLNLNSSPPRYLRRRQTTTIETWPPYFLFNNISLCGVWLYGGRFSKIVYLYLKKHFHSFQ